MREGLIAFMVAYLHKDLSEALEVDEIQHKVIRLKWEINKMFIMEEEPKNYKKGRSARCISWSN